MFGYIYVYMYVQSITERAEEVPLWRLVMMSCWLVSAVALLLSVSHVTAYPSYLGCSRDLTVGTSIMGYDAVSDSNAGVEFR